MNEKKNLEALKGYGSYKHRSEFSSPGKEVTVGTEGNVAFESLASRERIIQESNLLPIAFLEEGVLRQKAVVRLPKIDVNYPLGKPHGTGFLVSNSLVMTNNHVINNVAEAKEILVQFNYQEDLDGVAQPIDTWKLDPDSFFYTNAALDFSLVRVKRKPIFYKVLPPQIQPLNIEESDAEEIEAISFWHKKFLFSRLPGWKWGYIQLPKTVNYSVGQLLNCIQHPAGRMKELALQKNNVTHIFTDRIHYTTDTEPGSSGSPVFNNEWDLVALHHAAGDRDSATGQWIDNEGMRLDSISTHLINQFGTSNPELLVELGIQ